MLIMDMPNTPPPEPIILQARAAHPDTQKPYGTIGVCHLSPTAEQYTALGDARGAYSIDPRITADSLFFEGPHLDRLELDYRKATVSVLQHPKHGTLSKDFSLDKDISYHPNAGYAGNDKAEFLVNMVEGYKIKVVYFIKVNKLFNFDTNPDVGMYGRYCPAPNPWRISLQNSDPSAIQSLLSSTGITKTNGSDTIYFNHARRAPHALHK